MHETPQNARKAKVPPSHFSLTSPAEESGLGGAHLSPLGLFKVFLRWDCFLSRRPTFEGGNWGMAHATPRHEFESCFCGLMSKSVL